MSKKRNTGGKSKRGSKAKTPPPLINTPKAKKFLAVQGKKGTAKYKKRLKTYLKVFTKTEKNLDAAIKKTVRELDLNRVNRLKQVGVSKGTRTRKGKRLWVDEKTGKRISGKQVQTIVRNSIKYKSVQVLADKKKLSYEAAEKQFNKRVKAIATKIRNSKKFKTEITKWKRNGMTKREINERIVRVAEGRAKSRVIRQINPSPEMKATVIEN